MESICIALLVKEVDVGGRLLAMLRDVGCYESGFLNAKAPALRLFSMLRDHGCYQSLRQRTPCKQGLRGC